MKNKIIIIKLQKFQIQNQILIAVKHGSLLHRKVQSLLLKLHLLIFYHLGNTTLSKSLEECKIIFRSRLLNSLNILLEKALSSKSVMLVGRFPVLILMRSNIQGLMMVIIKALVI